MLLQDLAIDDNVIKIDNNKIIEERSKYLVQEGAKLVSAFVRPKGMTRMIHSISHMPSLALLIRLCELNNTSFSNQVW